MGGEAPGGRSGTAVKRSDRAGAVSSGPAFLAQIRRKYLRQEVDLRQDELTR